MKMIFTTAILSLFASATVFAAPADSSPIGTREVMNCKVPVQTGESTVSATITVSYESAADFIVVALTDEGQTSNLFTQMDKGEFDSSLEKGQVGFLLLEEGFSQDSGVIRRAGFFMSAKQADGKFQGMLSAKGNIYPMACTLL